MTGRSVLLTAKAWRLKLVFGAALLQFILVLWVSGPIPIPGRSVSDVVTPFAPLITTAALIEASAALVGSSVEIRHRRWRSRRLVLIAIVLGASAASIFAAAAASSAVVPLTLLRNSAIFVGVVLLVGDRRADGGMLALVAYSMVAWILGAGGLGQPPMSWAIPLHPLEDRIAAGLAIVILAGGLIRVLVQPRRLPRVAIG